MRRKLSAGAGAGSLGTASCAEAAVLVVFRRLRRTVTPAGRALGASGACPLLAALMQTPTTTSSRGGSDAVGAVLSLLRAVLQAPSSPATGWSSGLSSRRLAAVVLTARRDGAPLTTGRGSLRQLRCWRTLSFAAIPSSAGSGS